MPAFGLVGIQFGNHGGKAVGSQTEGGGNGLAPGSGVGREVSERCGRVQGTAGLIKHSAVRMAAGVIHRVRQVMAGHVRVGRQRVGRLHPLASAGAKSRTSNPAFGSKGIDTTPATRIVSGMCEAFNHPSTGKTALLYFRSCHPEYQDETSSVSPVSSALITTGRPSNVPVNRPAKISLGTYPCPACGSSSCRAEPTRHARRTNRCRWES